MADVASNEQQQTAKNSGQDPEEETEDILMHTEEELLRAEDTEQLKPEAVKSDTAVASGESLGRKSLESPEAAVVKALLCSFLV